jgi:hypothetical protein
VCVDLIGWCGNRLSMAGPEFEIVVFSLVQGRVTFYTFPMILRGDPISVLIGDTGVALNRDHTVIQSYTCSYSYNAKMKISNFKHNPWFLLPPASTSKSRQIKRKKYGE